MGRSIKGISRDPSIPATGTQGYSSDSHITSVLSVIWAIWTDQQAHRVLELLFLAPRDADSTFWSFPVEGFRHFPLFDHCLERSLLRWDSTISSGCRPGSNSNRPAFFHYSYASFPTSSGLGIDPSTFTVFKISLASKDSLIWSPTLL